MWDDLGTVTIANIDGETLVEYDVSDMEYRDVRKALDEALTKERR